MTSSERHALGTTLLLPIIGAAVLLKAPLWFGLLLLFICLIAVVWLVWTVLHDTSAPAVELPHGHEWDYLDRSDLADGRDH